MLKTITFLILTATLVLFQSTSWAQADFFETKEPPRAAEFIYRSSPRDSLIGVQLFGAIKYPGIYYVPPNTDVLKLITLAGGVDDANLSEVLVRKTDPSYPGIYELDIEKLIKSTPEVKPFKLAQDDFVYIPKNKAWISNDVSRSITIVSLLTSIVLTSVLIEKYQR